MTGDMKKVLREMFTDYEAAMEAYDEADGMLCDCEDELTLHLAKLSVDDVHALLLKTKDGSATASLIERHLADRVEETKGNSAL